MASKGPVIALGFLLLLLLNGSLGAEQAKQGEEGDDDYGDYTDEHHQARKFQSPENIAKEVSSSKRSNSASAGMIILLLVAPPIAFVISIGLIVFGIRAYKKRAARKAAEAEQQKIAELEAQQAQLAQEKAAEQLTQEASDPRVGTGAVDVPSSMVSKVDQQDSLASLRDDDGTYVMKESTEMPNSLEDAY